MAYRDQQHFIDALEKAGELVRIKTFVDPKLEIAEITDRISKSGNGGKALLFENTGYDFPVLMNAYGSERRMCMALGVSNLDDVAKEIENLFHLLSSPKESIIDKLKLLPKLGQFASWMPKVKSGRGECQEVVMKESGYYQTSCYYLLAKRWWTVCNTSDHSYKRSKYTIPEMLACTVCRYLVRHLPVCIGISIKFPQNILMNIKN